MTNIKLRIQHLHMSLNHPALVCARRLENFLFKLMVFLLAPFCFSISPTVASESGLFSYTDQVLEEVEKVRAELHGRDDSGQKYVLVAECKLIFDEEEEFPLQVYLLTPWKFEMGMLDGVIFKGRVKAGNESSQPLRGGHLGFEEGRADDKVNVVMYDRWAGIEGLGEFRRYSELLQKFSGQPLTIFPYYAGIERDGEQVYRNIPRETKVSFESFPFSDWMEQLQTICSEPIKRKEGWLETAPTS